MRILMQLLEISLYAAALFLALWGFGRLMGERLSPALRYALWFLVVARLCLPVTVESSIHVVHLPQEAAQQQEATQQQEVLAQAGGPESGIATALPTGTAQQAQGAPREVTVHPPAETGWGRNVLPTLLLVLWGGGICARAGCLLAAEWRLRRRVNGEGRAPGAHTQEVYTTLLREMGLRALPICVLPGLPTPMLRVGLRPAILLPESFEQEAESVLRMALRHELTHARRGDHLACLLLRILECVYWFHPVVWLLGRHMQRDMEIACDNAVARGMTGQERCAYAQLLVALFGQGAQGSLGALGMAEYARQGGKREAEQRIRGIFTRASSTGSVRAAAGLVCCALLLGCFTTACQPVREARAQEMVPAREETAATKALRKRLGAPIRYKEKVQDREFNVIVVDADILLPAVEALPIAATQKRRFTDEDIRRVADVVLGPDAKFVGSGADAFPVREVLEKELAIAQAALELEEEQRGFLNGTVYTQQSIDEITRKLETSIPFSAFAPVALQMVTTEEASYRHTSAYALTLHNSNIYNIYGGDTDAAERSYIGITPGTRPWQTLCSNGREAPYRVTITREQALAIAAPMVEALCPDLKPVYVGAAFLESWESLPQWGWRCVFMREVNGCGTAYGSQQPYVSVNGMSVPDYYESITMLVNDEGILSFAWNTPMTVTEVLEADAPLLPFADIAQIALAELRRMPLEAISLLWVDYLDSVGGYLRVEKMELGLFRVKMGEYGYQYRPVWQVHGSTQNPLAGNALQDYLIPVEVRESGMPVGGYYLEVHGDALPLLTLDAIDGSVIDLKGGY